MDKFAGFVSMISSYISIRLNRIIQKKGKNNLVSVFTEL